MPFYPVQDEGYRCVASEIYTLVVSMELIFYPCVLQLAWNF